MGGRTLALIAVAGLVLCIVLLRGMLLPFVLGAGLAYVCSPIVRRLAGLGLPRIIGVIVVFAVLCLLLALAVFLLLPLLQAQINTFIRNLPSYIDWVQKTVNPWLHKVVPQANGINADSLSRLIADHWGSTSNFASLVAKKAFASGTTLLSWVVTLLLVPVIMFYMLRDWDHMTQLIREQLPRRYESVIVNITSEINERLSHFVRGQALVMVVLGVIYVVGLWIAGLKLALVIGMGAGLVSFIPYVGVISGISVASLAMLVQTGEPIQVVSVLVVFAVGAVMEQMVLTPLLLGEAIGLHPVWVIFAILAGGNLFGFLGVLLALPAAAAIAVLVRHAAHHWRASDLYSTRD